MSGTVLMGSLSNMICGCRDAVVKASKVADVRWFGASQFTDSTIAIQKAWDAIPDGGMLTGGGCLFPVNGLELSQRENVKISNIGLVNGGESTVASIHDCPGLTIDGLIIDGNSAGTKWLHIENCDGHTITNSHFNNIGNGENDVWGVFIRNSNNGLVNRCSFKNAIGKSVARMLYYNDLPETNSQYNTVTENVFNGVYPLADGDALVVDNGFADSKITVSKNTFIDCSKRYIKLLCNAAEVYENTGNSDSLDAAMYAMLSCFGSSINIHDNSFDSKTGVTYGIAVGNGKPGDVISDVTISGNTVGGNNSSLSIAFYLIPEVSNIEISDNIANGFEKLVRGSFAEPKPANSVSILRNIADGLSDTGIQFFAPVSSLVVDSNVSSSVVSDRRLVLLDAKSDSGVTITSNCHSHMLGTYGGVVDVAFGNTINGVEVD